MNTLLRLSLLQIVFAAITVLASAATDRNINWETPPGWQAGRR